MHKPIQVHVTDWSQLPSSHVHHCDVTPDQARGHTIRFYRGIQSFIVRLKRWVWLFFPAKDFQLCQINCASPEHRNPNENLWGDLFRKVERCSFTPPTYLFFLTVQRRTFRSRTCVPHLLAMAASDGSVPIPGVEPGPLGENQESRPLDHVGQLEFYGILFVKSPTLTVAQTYSGDTYYIVRM